MFGQGLCERLGCFEPVIASEGEFGGSTRLLISFRFMRNAQSGSVSGYFAYRVIYSSERSTVVAMVIFVEGRMLEL